MTEAIVKSAEAGSKTFAGSRSRKYNYYEPKGRRSTLYEDVTVDVQPDPERHLLQGWIVSFSDGTPAYSQTRTKIKSSDWHKYRDPNGEWERNHYIRQSSIEKQVALTIQNAKAENQFAILDKTWVKILQEHLGASKHPEYGLGMLFQKAQRDGMTQMINNSILINSSDKLRYAQDIAIYLGEVATMIELDEAKGKENWMNNPVWQGVREVVETFGAATDWAEQLFATNLIYEPLVAELFRSGFLMQYAASHGDYATPTLVSTAEADFERNLDYTAEMFDVFFNDPEYGEENQQLAQRWLEKYVPLCVNASKQLQPIWSQPRVKVTSYVDAFNRAKERFSTILAHLNISLPKGVSL
ncbi:toluene hydroxylase [Fictibacillus sp. WQ 8-8]|uniref:toluene hydroxylase n=1 Tax=Fictibacillus sp. WQ 8-8 TaxID=2938788 RepID=UPI00210B52D6|nr:toluene hydroxylase [Fictibacillus sp. WQ 8-8]MCQ6267790.1 toluene hydroxylase [Fictibacillus sp. WQ 8-8]